ncbi:MAG TPA: hypothetical protein PK971_11015 [Saprospiraceae bacterium]|nr:hypothetical protein [Saprospiraceae bacterium]
MAPPLGAQDKRADATSSVHQNQSLPLAVYPQPVCQAPFISPLFLEHVQVYLIERKQGISVLDKAVFTDIASGYGEENQRSPKMNLPLESD